LFLAILFVTRATWAVPPDECKPVPFDEVREELGPRNGVGVARIVLRADDVTFNSLLCLRQSLKSAHRDWVSVTVLAFFSRQAALNFDADKMATARDVGTFDRDLMGVYWIGAAPDGDSLTLTPLGWELLQQDDYNTVVVFPTPQTPRCRIELNRRCVLALRRVQYPLEALRHTSAGTVTLTGMISKQGNPIDVKVSAVDLAGEQRNLLIESALNNVRTWRLEPASKQEIFRLKVVFSVDPSLRNAYTTAIPALRDRFRDEGITRVEFEAEQVTIRGALPE